MADWYQITRHFNRGKTSFGVIGSPFQFIPHSVHGDPNRVLRCHPGLDLSREIPPLDSDNHYDLTLQNHVDESIEVFEPGWYLSGVGHHLLWCAATLEEAVDAAQEHIAWDGGDPTNLPLPGPVMVSFGGGDEEPLAISHRITYLDPSVWEDDDLWFGMFTGKKVKREK